MLCLVQRTRLAAVVYSSCSQLQCTGYPAWSWLVPAPQLRVLSVKGAVLGCLQVLAVACACQVVFLAKFCGTCNSVQGL
jgi:hypothetical protein